MEQRIIQYVSYLKGIYLKEYDDEERKKICEQVLVQIGFFQHERLIHLIVTVTFALLAYAQWLLLCHFLDWSVSCLCC